MTRVIDSTDSKVVPNESRDARVVETLKARLRTFVGARTLGRVVRTTVFAPSQKYFERLPDFAFVAYDDSRNLRTPTWKAIPDLVVEVVRDADLMIPLVGRIQHYFEAGVRKAWIVLPRFHDIYVYDSPKMIRILDRDDELTGDPVIPGFRLPLAELFADEPEIDDATTA